ncbi:hypothetical protein ACEN3H_01505 [Acinetobacter lactucae]|uniref:hypothetical protein n=1 Tax=Acinetobacter lactucae TaxID=1785128 RepID=UPI00358DBD0D
MYKLIVLVCTYLVINHCSAASNGFDEPDTPTKKILEVMERENRLEKITLTAEEYNEFKKFYRTEKIF